MNKTTPDNQTPSQSNDDGKIIASFLSRVLSSSFDGPSTLEFLGVLKSLPLGLTYLNDIYSFCTGNQAKQNSIVRALESRYIRVKFVQASLEKIEFKKAKGGESFNDFIFNQTDFSIYTQFSKEEFETLFTDGLENYSDAFFVSVLKMKRKEAERVISRAYKKTGGRYILTDSNPLILAVMRTLHTSLDFVPLPSIDKIIEELKSLVNFFIQHNIIDGSFNQVLEKNADELFLCILSLFHKTECRHNDGMTTRLFIAPVLGKTLLCAAFTPERKPYTAALAPADLPLTDQAAPSKDFTPLPDAALLRDKQNRLSLVFR